MRTLLVVIATLALSYAAPVAQRGRGNAAPTNLQVLPKDTPPQEVGALMQQFTQALGVECTYCHIQAAPALVTPGEAAAAGAAGRGRRGQGQGPAPMDYASDEKAQKAVARAMLRLVNDINATIRTRVAKASAPAVTVQCATCHRGITNPQQLGNLLSQTMLTKGESAAVSSYRELRQKYQGTQAYDFREPVLVGLAQQSLATGKPDDALAWARLNVEFYPQSAPSYVAMADAHVRKRDRSAAIADLEKALMVDPSNAQAKSQLDLLKKQEPARR